VGRQRADRLRCLEHIEQGSGYLTVNQADLGYPYRVRADYFRSSTDTSNLNAVSGWLYFMVEK